MAASSCRMRCVQGCAARQRVARRLRTALVPSYRLHALRASLLYECTAHHACHLSHRPLTRGWGSGGAQQAAPVPPPVVGRACREKWVAEFNYLRAQAVEPLATFLDYITCVTRAACERTRTQGCAAGRRAGVRLVCSHRALTFTAVWASRYEYVIDNVLMILKATLDDDSVDPKRLLAAAHPLGRFKESTMKAIAAFDNSPRGYEELYGTVLIDTPVGTACTCVMWLVSAGCLMCLDDDGTHPAALRGGSVSPSLLAPIAHCERRVPCATSLLLQASTFSSSYRSRRPARSSMAVQRRARSSRRCRTRH